jgi:hypothetical protein
MAGVHLISHCQAHSKKSFVGMVCQDTAQNQMAHVQSATATLTAGGAEARRRLEQQLADVQHRAREAANAREAAERKLEQQSSWSTAELKSRDEQIKYAS